MFVFEGPISGCVLLGYWDFASRIDVVSVVVFGWSHKIHPLQKRSGIANACDLDSCLGLYDEDVMLAG